MIDFAQFHFLRPWWLLALLGIALLAWLMVQRKLGSRSWEAICDPALLPHVLIRTATRSRRWSTALTLLGGLLAILALAGPVWEKLPQPVFSSTSSLVIALDMSLSMDADDVKPSRLARARYKIADILNLRTEGQTALVVYTSDSYTVTPLTDDTATIASQLNALSTDIMPVQGNRVDRVLAHAGELLQQAGAVHGDVLLISNAVDAGRAASRAQEMRSKGYRVSVLGIGTDHGVPVPLADGGFLKDDQGRILVPVLNEKSLRAIAADGGGMYVHMTQDDADVMRLQKFFSGQRLKTGEQATQLQTDVWREQGPWLVLLLVPLMALMFRRGYLLVLLICLLPLPAPVQAFDWQDLWLRKDQQAERAFAAGEHKRAAQLFRDPAWKGSAQYRAGDYSAAEKSLEQDQDTESLYNRGNALARLGRYQEAIAAYDEVLKRAPDHEDARYNRKLVERRMQQNQQNQQQSDQKDRQQKNQQQQNQQQDQSGRQAENQQQQQDNRRQQDRSEQQQAQQDQQEQQQRQQQEQQSRQQAASDPQQQEDGDQQQRQLAQNKDDITPDEQQQELEQWLRRIPDDPGGLLRRKFLYQYQQRNNRQREDDDTW